MSTKTPNFNLLKPELTDAADITKYNTNWDIIDNNLGKVNRTVPIEKGGTGGITAEQARDNLGVTAAINRLKENVESSYIPTSEKGSANGVATLGEDSKVPANQLPDMNYVKSSEKGTANGVATLDSDGNVPEDQLAIKIKKFTYTGTGTYGSNGSNRTIIGIDGFIPKLVVISNGYDVALIPIINVSGGATKGIFFSPSSEGVNFADNSYDIYLR